MAADQDGSGQTAWRPWVRDQAMCQPDSGNWSLSVCVMSGYLPRAHEPTSPSVIHGWRPIQFRLLVSTYAPSHAGAAYVCWAQRNQERDPHPVLTLPKYRS